MDYVTPPVPLPHTTTYFPGSCAFIDNMARTNSLFNHRRRHFLAQIRKTDPKSMPPSALKQITLQRYTPYSYVQTAVGRIDERNYKTIPRSGNIQRVVGSFGEDSQLNPNDPYSYYNSAPPNEFNAIYGSGAVPLPSTMGNYVTATGVPSTGNPYVDNTLRSGLPTNPAAADPNFIPSGFMGSNEQGNLPARLPTAVRNMGDSTIRVGDIIGDTPLPEDGMNFGLPPLHSYLKSGEQNEEDEGSYHTANQSPAEDGGEAETPANIQEGGGPEGIVSGIWRSLGRTLFGVSGTAPTAEYGPKRTLPAGHDQTNAAVNNGEGRAPPFIASRSLAETAKHVVLRKSTLVPIQDTQTTKMELDEETLEESEENNNYVADEMRGDNVQHTPTHNITEMSEIEAHKGLQFVPTPEVTPPPEPKTVKGERER